MVPEGGCRQPHSIHYVPWGHTLAHTSLPAFLFSSPIYACSWDKPTFEVRKQTEGP